MKIHSSFFENVKTKSLKMDKSTMDITLVYTLENERKDIFIAART